MCCPTCPMGENANKIEFLRILGEKLGNVKKACAEAGVPRSTYYHWRKTDEEFAGQCDIIIASHREKKQEDRRAAMIAEEGEREVAGMIEPEHYEGKSAKLLAHEHEVFLTEAMKSAGIYDESHAAQIKTAAKLHASIDILFSELDRYAPVQTEISREGNTRLVSNPIHEMIRRQTDTYTSVLKSLGLNFDAKVKAKEEDGLESFFKSMKEEER